MGLRIEEWTFVLSVSLNYVRKGRKGILTVSNIRKKIALWMLSFS